MIIYLAGENNKTQILAQSYKTQIGGQINDNIFSRRTPSKERDNNGSRSSTNWGGYPQITKTIPNNGNIHSGQSSNKTEFTDVTTSSTDNWGGQMMGIPNLADQQILESFYYARNNQWIPKLIPHFKSFLLDSGAFTFRTSMKDASRLVWEKYTDEYAEFINAYNIQNFIEMDIDSLIGLEEVEKLRCRLENKVGRQSIPVWHNNRGLEYFHKMVKEYKYVAIATTQFGVEGRTMRKHDEIISYFINTAHRNHVKIHGLGYTSTANLRKFHFDSVDSTAWLYGNRGGFLYRFNPSKGTFFEKIQAPQGMRLNPQKAALHNYNEWVKLQRYAEKYL